MIISFLVVSLAITGWLASRAIPRPAAQHLELRIRINFMAETWSLIAYSIRHRGFYRQCSRSPGSGWWVPPFLAQLPTFGKISLGGDEGVVTLLLMVFRLESAQDPCCAIACCEVRSTHLCALWRIGDFIVCFGTLLCCYRKPARSGRQRRWGNSVSLRLVRLREVLDMFLIAASGGIYVVPLNAAIQARSEQAHRARNIATVNIMNALFMVISAVCQRCCSCSILPCRSSFLFWRSSIWAPFRSLRECADSITVLAPVTFPAST